MKNLTKGILAGEHGKECGCGFLVSTLVEGVNDDEGRGWHCLKWTNDEFFHLGTKCLPSNPRVCPQDLDQLLSKQGVPICKLKGECWEDRLKVTPVLKISREKETCTKFPLREGNLGKCLGDCQLSGPHKAVEPKHALALLIGPPTNLRAVRGHPFSFPSGSPACFQSDVRPQRCGVCHSEGSVPCLPVHKLLHMVGQHGSRAHNESAAPLIDILL